jgi:hypothetical protein
MAIQQYISRILLALGITALAVLAALALWAAMPEAGARAGRAGPADAAQAIGSPGATIPEAVGDGGGLLFFGGLRGAGVGPTTW